MAKYDSAAGRWSVVGGPMRELVGGGDSLYGISPVGGDLCLYTGTNWTVIGGPGAQFVAYGASLYRLSTDKQEIYRYVQ